MASRRILLLAGGRSDEHEISIVSARSVLAALEGSTIAASVQVVGRDGRWLDADASRAAIARGHAQSGDAADDALHGACGVVRYDAVFPLLHGPFGEDGRIQGVFEVADVPYVGSGVLASAVCMDKIMSKQVLQAVGLPQVDWLAFDRRSFAASPTAAAARIAHTLPPPWFVKPANMGSSIGVTRVTERQGLQPALQLALAYDRRTVVEAGVERARELEVAVLGNSTPDASPVGEITYQADFYDYSTKYTEGRAQLHVPTELPIETAERCRDLARSAYAALDCAGFARVDFFLRPSDGALLVNELNTIPGFTPLSMFPKLWAAGGIAFVPLIERLVQLAIARHAEGYRPQGRT